LVRIAAGQLICYFAGVEIGDKEDQYSEYSISLQGERRLDIPEEIR
jgi:hypothetical protein